jgi:hypothetical protein
MANLWDDGGFENNTAVTDVGTPTTSARSNEQAHTGTYSWKVVADATGEGIQRSLSGIIANQYYTVSAWIYLTSGSVKFECGANTWATLQSGSATSVAMTTVGQWKKVQCVVRAKASSIFMQFLSYTAGASQFYIDDVFIRKLDDVSLTVTPASAANSLEGTGYRVDGTDLLTQPIPVGKLKATKGRIRFKWTPRHSAANFEKYGSTNYVYEIIPSGNNRILLYCPSANNTRLYINAGGLGVQTADWNCTGLIVAGVTYLVEILYTSSKAVLKIDGVIRATITSSYQINFTEVFTIASICGSSTNIKADSVISPP